MMRQPLFFLLIGGMQYLLDATLFGFLLSAGLGITISNVLSRGLAAAIGFLANRYLTFGKQSDTFVSFSGSLVRFVILWITMTAISTALMLAISRAWDADLTTQVISKLLVEAVLAVVSFLFSKYWVFRD